MKPIYNTDIPTFLWCKRFTRDALRNIAREHGVKRGRDARDAASNLALGIGSNGMPVRFQMDLYVPLEEKR